MRNYEKELKDRAVKDVQETGNITAVATKHRIPIATLHCWVKKNRNGNQINQGQKLRRLQAELDDARLENEILKSLLKKTNLVWLKESK